MLSGLLSKTWEFGVGWIKKSRKIELKRVKIVNFVLISIPFFVGVLFAAVIYF